MNDDLIALAQDADVLVHQVADLGYLDATALPGPPSLEWRDCRPTSTTSEASPNAHTYVNSF